MKFTQTLAAVLLAAAFAPLSVSQPVEEPCIGCIGSETFDVAFAPSSGSCANGALSATLDINDGECLPYQGGCEIEAPCSATLIVQWANIPAGSAINGQGSIPGWGGNTVADADGGGFHIPPVASVECGGGAKYKASIPACGLTVRVKGECTSCPE